MEELKHECGVAMIRLLKPLEYYQKKYGTWMYGLNKLYLMMEKQHNRGQEGAGMACVNLDTEPGSEYMFRERAEGSNAITEIFGNVHKKLNGVPAEKLSDAEYAKKYLPFAGDIYMGHLRYSTTGKSGLQYVHPFLRRNNWRSKNLCLCGNFNMTNIDEVFEMLTQQGQCPRVLSDSYLMLEHLGHRLDRETERIYKEAKEKGYKNKELTKYIEDNIKVANVLKTSMHYYDGGFVVCGITGSGEMFAVRDPHGLRPAFWYQNDEIIALASERPVLQTTFDLECGDIHELNPGEAVIVTKHGKFTLEQILPVEEERQCAFERIYFSRGSDRDIYKERKKLGEHLTESILKTIDYDTKNTVFSFIPNTAEVAFYGMVEGFNKYLNEEKVKKIQALEHTPTAEELHEIMSQCIRAEKVAWKDIKLRTFIAEGNSRNDLASHVYDITYESVVPYKDNLVIIDDSIVRGTTLRNSILKILDRLHPRKIVIVSSSPQIRYPDFYGIDMAKMDDFCVFKATVELIKDRGMEHLLDEVYENCKKEILKPKAEMQNCVKAIYEPFTVEEINKKIVEILCPDNVTTPIKIVYQSIEGMREAIPNHSGDWYFTGDYPTPGGMKHCNLAYINYYENRRERH